MKFTPRISRRNLRNVTIHTCPILYNLRCEREPGHPRARLEHGLISHFMSIYHIIGTRLLAIIHFIEYRSYLKRSIEYARIVVFILFWFWFSFFCGFMGSLNSYSAMLLQCHWGICNCPNASKENMNDRDNILPKKTKYTKAKIIWIHRGMKLRYHLADYFVTISNCYFGYNKNSVLVDDDPRSLFLAAKVACTIDFILFTVMRHSFTFTYQLFQRDCWLSNTTVQYFLPSSRAVLQSFTCVRYYDIIILTNVTDSWKLSTEGHRLGQSYFKCKLKCLCIQIR